MSGDPTEAAETYPLGPHYSSSRRCNTGALSAENAETVLGYAARMALPGQL